MTPYSKNKGELKEIKAYSETKRFSFTPKYFESFACNGIFTMPEIQGTNRFNEKPPFRGEISSFHRTTTILCCENHVALKKSYHDVFSSQVRDLAGIKYV